jgi:hypothetical protein
MQPNELTVGIGNSSHGEHKSRGELHIERSVQKEMSDFFRPVN